MICKSVCCGTVYVYHTVSQNRMLSKVMICRSCFFGSVYVERTVSRNFIFKKVMLCKRVSLVPFTCNLLSLRFRTVRVKDNYGNAVELDPHLNTESRTEWNRKIEQKDGSLEEVLCNAEDVKRTDACKHNEGDGICSNCRIPICNECWRHALRDSSIPKALANDNFIGYMLRFFLEENVTWLEATIACPFFTGLVTYYIEGPPVNRHHLMEESVAQPELQYGVRGNIFTNLMDWETIHEQLRELTRNGIVNLEHWPVEPAVVAQVARVQVRFVRGPEALLNKFKQLKVRAEIVRQVAYIYIEKHLCGLDLAKGAKAIKEQYGGGTLAESLRKHVDKRMAEHYPPAQYPAQGGGLTPAMVQLLGDRIDALRSKVGSNVSGFDFKQSTMPDAAQADLNDVFETVRPLLVLDQSSVDNVLGGEVQFEHALGQIASVDIKLCNNFEDQFNSRYLPLALPWALNYNCGGPEYPHLFAKDPVTVGDDDELADPVIAGIQTWWRR